jgi:hypothetical protein
MRTRVIATVLTHTRCSLPRVDGSSREESPPSPWEAGIWWGKLWALATRSRKAAVDASTPSPCISPNHTMVGTKRRRDDDTDEATQTPHMCARRRDRGRGQIRCTDAVTEGQIAASARDWDAKIHPEEDGAPQRHQRCNTKVESQAGLRNTHQNTQGRDGQWHADHRSQRRPQRETEKQQAHPRAHFERRRER